MSIFETMKITRLLPLLLSKFLELVIECTHQNFQVLSIPKVSIEKFDVEQCILAYSDLPYETVGHKIAWVNQLGPDIRLMGPKNTSIKSKKPVIAGSKEHLNQE